MKKPYYTICIVMKKMYICIINKCLIMKRILFLLLLLSLVSCGTMRTNTNPMSQSYLLSEGMSMQEVQDILGLPVASELLKGVTEWHYCRTGIMADEFVSVFFEKGKLIAVKNYTVTAQDVGGAGWSCKSFIKRGTYREPDEVIAVRARYGD